MLKLRLASLVAAVFGVASCEACDRRTELEPTEERLELIEVGDWTITPIVSTRGQEVRSCAQSYSSAIRSYSLFIELETRPRTRSGEPSVTRHGEAIAWSNALDLGSPEAVANAIGQTTFEHCLAEDGRTAAIRARGPLVSEPSSGHWWTLDLSTVPARLTRADVESSASCSDVIR